MTIDQEAPPTAVGGYILEEVLGRGGMGIVYRATHAERDEPIALKLIAGATWDEVELERFRHETRVARAVAHRHILPVYEAGEADGAIFVAMKLAPGGDLGSLIRRKGRLEPERAVEIVRQVAAALDEAHAHGLVHRDVKPGNILLDELRGREHAYIADFGVTRVAFQDDAAGADALVGTVGYASPEQIRGEPIDPRSDVYSLACVLYECLTGRVPFERRDSLATMWAQLRDEPPAPGELVVGLPSQLDSVLARALAKHPADRYQSAGAFAEAASATLAGESLPAEAADTPLPVPQTAFVGRKDELAEGRGALAASRLMTVTGPGGAGKTRFALELARRAAGEYEDGVFICFLASLRDPTLVTATLCRSIGVIESPGQSALDALKAHLSEKRLLLVIDNVEHVATVVPELGQLLAEVGGLSILATSRERLYLADELAYELPPLRQMDAEALFCDRAVVEPDEVVAAICDRLEGLPLAIELAAAQVDWLSLPELQERLSSRLDGLAEAPEADARQATLRATIQWSYDLLTSEEQRLFTRLSVFVGGCTLEAAREVCGADPESLDALLAKSLLRRTDERYWMLEAIREYAGERLEESGGTAEMQQRHADFVLAFAEEGKHGLRGPQADSWFEKFDVEQGNLRAALTWLETTGQADAVLDLVSDTMGYWYTRGAWHEARRWLEPALTETAGERSRTRARGLRVAASMASTLGDLASARSNAEESLGILRELGDTDEIARVLGNLGIYTAKLGDVATGMNLIEEAADLFRASGDRYNLAVATGNLGVFAMREGDHARAEALLEEELALYRELGREHGVHSCLYNLAFLRFELHLDVEAVAAARESLSLSHRVGDVRHVLLDLELLAALAARTGASEKAARLLAAAEAERERIAFPLEDHLVALRDETARGLRAELGDEGFQAALTAGSAMTLDEAVAYALDGPSDA